MRCQSKHMSAERVNRPGRRCLRRFWAAAALTVAMMGCFSHGWMHQAEAGTYTVQAEHEYVQNATLMDMKRLLRAEAMARIAAKEAGSILPNPLPEKRRHALETFIKPEVDRYILNFSELGFQRKEVMCTMELRAEVNVPALKDYLKKWGTYYTSQRPMYYSLISPPLSQEEEKTLQRLEALSGLERMYSGYPLMTLEQLDESEGKRRFWRGTLKTMDKSWSAMDSKLKNVWADLWSEFFAQPKIQSQTFETVRLSVQGWTSVTAIEAFHRQLTRWSTAVDRVSLERVDMELGQSTGHWQVRTNDRDHLDERLGTYFSERGLSYSLRSNSHHRGSGNATGLSGQ